MSSVRNQYLFSVKFIFYMVPPKEGKQNLDENLNNIAMPNCNLEFPMTWFYVEKSNYFGNFFDKVLKVFFNKKNDIIMRKSHNLSFLFQI